MTLSQLLKKKNKCTDKSLRCRHWTSSSSAKSSAKCTDAERNFFCSPCTDPADKANALANCSSAQCGNASTVFVDAKRRSFQSAEKSDASRKLLKLETVALCVIVITVIVALGLVLFYYSSSGTFSQKTQESPSRLGRYRTAAVSSDGIPCSQIGRAVMADGGNAVDAAIATTFCIGVVNPQSAGIGGGLLMTLYNTTARRAVCLNARETAPMAATENMFHGHDSLSQRGALSVAVPGEVAGSWEAHRRYGKLPWRRLVLPSARLAENGLAVNGHLANALKKSEQYVLSEPSMWMFLNESTGRILQKGDTLKNPALARTLKEIANYGAEVFYNGSLADKMVADVQQRGGIITREDLSRYRPEWIDPVKVNLNGNWTVYSVPAPGSGVLTAFILNVLSKQLKLERNASADPPLSKDPLTYHYIAETFKHAYAYRTKLGDPAFVAEVDQLTEKLTSEEFAANVRAKISDKSTFDDPTYYGAVTYNRDDHGTSHLSVVDGEGLAVSITSTINLYFGAGFISQQTGIIMNDEMDDFAAPNIVNAFGVPPSPANFIQPGKRPMSSMTPTIVANSATGKVRLVIGAAGGTRITTSVAYVAMRNLWFGENIKEAIDGPRIHHQLIPMSFQYEAGFPEDIVKNLSSKGHSMSPFGSAVGAAVICAIEMDENGMIQANSDHRKGGDTAGIDQVDAV